MISLAIPTYNRVDMTIESFSKILDNPLISEIVICDDYSDRQEYIRLCFAKLDFKIEDYGKIKLYRNDENLGPFKNKYETVKHCTNKWVILLDSDNIIDNRYISDLPVLDGNQEKNILYCPETLINSDGATIWDYSKIDRLINKDNVKQFISSGNFQAFLNTGNYFVNRDQYLKVHEQKINKELSVNDALYFSYLWLKSNSMFIVPGLTYTHRVHKGSWYKNNQKECGRATDEIIKLIKQL